MCLFRVLPLFIDEETPKTACWISETFFKTSWKRRWTEIERKQHWGTNSVSQRNASVSCFNKQLQKGRLKMQMRHDMYDGEKLYQTETCFVHTCSKERIGQYQVWNRNGNFRLNVCISPVTLVQYCTVPFTHWPFCICSILIKGELALRYLLSVVIESGVQNFIANSVWFLLHSIPIGFCHILCLSVFPRKYVVPADIDIQLQRRNL